MNDLQSQLQTIHPLKNQSYNDNKLLELLPLLGDTK